MTDTTAGGNLQPQLVAPGDGPPSDQASPPPVVDAATSGPVAQANLAPLDAGTAFKAKTAEPNYTQADTAAADLPSPVETAEEPYDDQPPDSDGEAITWTASEFVNHDKTLSWYAGLGLVAVVLAGLIYLLTRDLVSSAMVIVAAILFGILAARQPRQLQYELDSHGVHVGLKYYSLQAFRSFSVVPEGAFSSIIFMPLKRFSPLMTIYFAPEDENRIVDLLTANLPMEEFKHDPLDRLMRQIRF